MAEGLARIQRVVAARAHSAITMVAAAASSAVPKSIISIVYRFFFSLTFLTSGARFPHIERSRVQCVTVFMRYPIVFTRTPCRRPAK